MVFFWVNYHISLTWIKPIKGDDFPNPNYDFQWASHRLAKALNKDHRSHISFVALQDLGFGKVPRERARDLGMDGIETRPGEVTNVAMENMVV